MKIAFVINSLLSSKKRIKSLFKGFEKEDVSLAYFPTEYPAHAIDLANKLKGESYDWIVSVGGDGTLNEIVHGLFEDPVPDEVLPKIASFPKGTGNDFSLSLATTTNPETLMKAILSGKCKSIDIGKIESPSSGIRYFINVADAGMGGDITRRIRTSGNVIGKWVYYKTILQSFLTYQRPTLRITLPDKVLTSKIITVVVANGISFGGGYKVGYDAKLDDGQFFIAVIGDISILTYLFKLPQLIRGKKIDHPQVAYYKAAHIKLENISEIPCYIEMDGEPGFACPVSFECLASKLQFLTLD